jgi:integrase
VQARGLKVDNPAEAIRPSAIASFKPRDRTLSPAEIHVFFSALEQTPTMPTLRLAIRFMLLTLVRKSEFILAMWGEIDFDAAVWAIPKERMKAGHSETLMSLSCGAVELKPDTGASRSRIVPELKQTSLELELLLRDVRFQPG